MLAPNQITQAMLYEIGDAIDDGISGRLSEAAALFAIHSILNPGLITKEDIEWAKEQTEKRKVNHSGNGSASKTE